MWPSNFILIPTQRKIEVHIETYMKCWNLKAMMCIKDKKGRSQYPSSDKHLTKGGVSIQWNITQP